MSGQFRFKNLKHLVEIIKALKAVDSSIDYTPTFARKQGIPPQSNIFHKILFKKNNLEDVEYILKDMESDRENFINLLYYISSSIFVNKARSKVLKMILEYSFKNIRNNMDDLLYNFGSQLFSLYMKTGNKNLLEYIINNLADFPYTDIPDELMDIIVRRFDRDEYMSKVTKIYLNEHTYTSNTASATELDDKMNARMAKKYDDAVKRRLTDVSFGLGYAQFDKADRDGNEPIYNQIHPNISSLALQYIANESVDLSGIPAQDVYKIIKHVNEGMTNDTIRLGVEYNFADAKE
jgi:hypothetical protein